MSNSSSEDTANCQNKIKISEFTWLEISLIFENSSSLSEKFVLSRDNEFIFLK